MAYDDPITPGHQREALALLRAGGPAYYRHADFPMIRRLGAADLAVVTLLTLVLLPAAPPTAHAAAAVGLAAALGLLVAGATAAVALATGRWRTGATGTLGLAFATIAGLGVLDTLAGREAPYDKLYVLLIVWAAATHTPRRVLAVVAFAAGARLLSLAEAGWPAAEAAEAFSEVIVWLALAAFALVWTAGVRAQRHRMRHEQSTARALARVDALTGLGNRRAFDEALATEVARAARSGRPLSLVVADLDDFKAINDKHGHLAGDRCLRQVAAVFGTTVRRPDSCFRWGGDEFALLLEDTGLGEAEAVADRELHAVLTDSRAPGASRLSFGYGVAEFDGSEGPEALLARADRALLVAKAAVSG